MSGCCIDGDGSKMLGGYRAAPPSAGSSGGSCMTDNHAGMVRQAAKSVRLGDGERDQQSALMHRPREEVYTKRDAR